jgi:UDP-2,3-diacylglucosamine hydrolase
VLVLPPPCYVFSDTHLGAAPKDVERRLLAFLRTLHGQAGSLVINGDLFEFWFEWKWVIPRASFRVLAALADLVESGTRILWVAGNHDCWGGDVLRHDIGVDYHVGEWMGTLAGWRTRIEHGDGLREVEDRKYRRLRAVLRHPASVWAFRHLLHPDFGSRLAAGSSHASRTYQARDGGRGLRAVAMAELGARPDLELLIYGHSHVAALERAPGGGVYANAGSWMSRPTYLRVDERRVALLTWDGSAEGECLDALDRRAEKPLTEAEKVVGGVGGDEPMR